VNAMTVWKFSLGVLLTLFTGTLVLTSSAPAYAQSSTRSFQMALWDYPTAGPNADIATFYPTEGQPAGRSILIGWNPTIPLNAQNAPFVWSGIVAMQIDEPYSTQYTSVDNVIRNADGTPACHPAGLNAAMAPMDAMLAQRAAELKAVAPRARFWVNLTYGEALWIQACGSPQTFNRTYIDVISFDWYSNFPGFQSFDATIKPVLTTLLSSAPKTDQQLALTPGVFSAPANQLPYLADYFNYANSMNQSCNLPLGSRGVTGIYDGCTIWAVLGFLAGNTSEGSTQYLGMLDPNSAAIATAWQNELALPLGPGLVRQRTRALQPALQLLVK
jgi:hypothetical protein